MRRYVSAYGMPIVPVTNTGLTYNYRWELVEVSISISINGELPSNLLLKATTNLYA